MWRAQCWAEPTAKGHNQDNIILTVELETLQTLSHLLQIFFCCCCCYSVLSAIWLELNAKLQYFTLGIWVPLFSKFIAIAWYLNQTVTNLFYIDKLFLYFLWFIIRNQYSENLTYLTFFRFFIICLLHTITCDLFIQIISLIILDKLKIIQLNIINNI